MKKSHLLLLTVFIIMLSFFSCEKQEKDVTEKGTFELSLNFKEGETLKSAGEDTIRPGVHYLLITVVNEEGVRVFEDEKIPLYSFGSGYISNKIEIEAGSYRLTRFFVVGPDNEVLYAAPQEGSPKAYLVNNPLPLAFKIVPGEVTRLAPQVLSVGNALPSDFGYASFGFQVVTPVAVYTMAIIDNPLLLAPTQMTEAELRVVTESGWKHRFHLEAKVNKIFIPAGSDSYRFTIYHDTYGLQVYKFSERQLRASTEEDPIILRFYQTIGNKLILQPGPEGGKDATITNLDPDKNMGDYPWFEASFLSEPVLTVMRNKRSLINFEVRDFLPENTRIDSVFLTLWFEQPLWDSLQPETYGEEQNLYLVLRQITQPWEEYGVTWNNQPETIGANEVHIPLMPWMSSNQRIINVSSLFVPVQEIAAPNYGMMLRFPGTPEWSGMRFASSDYPVKEMRPRLTVWYSYMEDPAI